MSGVEAIRPVDRIDLLEPRQTMAIRGRFRTRVAVWTGIALIGAADITIGQTVVDVPLMRGAGHPTQQGFVRVTAVATGTIAINAWNDAGEAASASLSVEGGRTVHFNSDDLEFGNQAKGIPAGLGSGFGDSFVQLKADFEFVATSYVRTGDGFLTAMGNILVPVDGDAFGTACVYEANIFNPASNTDQVSSLRIVERAGDDTAVNIYGVDDHGITHGPVGLTVRANGARTVTSQQLEHGDPNLTDTLPDGAGKWRLAIATDGAIVVMNLLQSPTGHLSNLGPVVLSMDSDSDDLETPRGCTGAPPHRLVARPGPSAGNLR
ncbi:MAG: hypothetical protein OXI79_05310 [Gammaproteobacteria bacterium]|nr:hypothetical protein [Gammaproteobacteria bacterium]